MDLQITNHAQTRFRQRGISSLVLEYLMQYGDSEVVKGGAYRIYLTKKNANNVIRALKKEIHKIERAQGLIIVEKAGSILTGYHRQQ
jgi:hypothetical protein